MSVTLRLFGILCGIFLIFVSVKAVVKRSITEIQSLFWIFSGVIIIILCAVPSLIISVADFFGVKYAPSIIFAVAIGIIIYGLFYCFRKIAELSRKVDDLAINLSIMSDIDNKKTDSSESDKPEDMRKL